MVILSLLGAAIAIEGARPQVAPTRATLRRYLTDQIGYSDRDWRDVLAGRAVARNLDTPEAVDVSIFGAVRVRGRARELVEQIREIDVFERKLNILGVGRFNDPPRLSDLDGLELLGSDIQDLRNCRPGDCELQLSETAMARFDTLVDWDSADAPSQATRIYREMIFDALRAYRIGGVDTLGTFADRNPPTPISEEVHGLANPLDTPTPIPELTRFLRDYPRSRLPGADDFFYWNMGEFGMKPTTRLNQVVIQPFPIGAASLPGLRYVIATRQIYANHYFSATLELRTLVDDEDEDDGFFLLYATRSRVTGLSGFFKGLLRAIVKRRARSGMDRYLMNTQAVIEGRPPGTPRITRRDPSSGRWID
ncbi:MAG: hypothetical protein O3C10_08115 [Chloroflexi bacterium]|nr:hypothetical protein [Chloroflexota bacterium]